MLICYQCWRLEIVSVWERNCAAFYVHQTFIYNSVSLSLVKKNGNRFICTYLTFVTLVTTLGTSYHYSYHQPQLLVFTSGNISISSAIFHTQTMREMIQMQATWCHLICTCVQVPWIDIIKHGYCRRLKCLSFQQYSTVSRRFMSAFPYWIIAFHGRFHPDIYIIPQRFIHCPKAMIV